MPAFLRVTDKISITSPDSLASSHRNSSCAAAGTWRTIVRELVETVRNNATIDWAVKESVRVKRLHRSRYAYPRHKREKATQTALEQAELFVGNWAT